MNRIKFALIVTPLIAAFVIPAQVFGWGASRSFSASGRFGGSFSHASATSGGWGGFSHAGASSYTSPSGQSYSASHYSSGVYGGGSAAYHGSYSTSTGHYGSYSGGASYYGYHAPSYTSVSYGCSGSGFGAGLVAGAVTGAVVGAAVASAAQPTVVAPVVVNPVYTYPEAGVYAAPAPVVLPPPASPTPLVSWPVGATVTTLPAGFSTITLNGTQYYQSGATWFQMRFGNQGAYFVVVPAP